MPSKQHNNTLAPQTSGDIVHQVIEMGNGFQIDIPNDINEIKARIIKAEVTNVLSAVEAGVYYNHLKETLEHGDYQNFLKELGVSRFRAAEQIRVSKLFQKLNVRSTAHLEGNKEISNDGVDGEVLAHFNLTQLVELTRLPEQQLEQLDPPKLAEFSQMPVKQLRLAVKEICQEHNEENKLLAENARLKRLAEAYDEQRVKAINDYNHELIRKAPETVYGLPTLLAEIQSNAPALSEQLTNVVVQLSHQVENLCGGTLDYKQAAQAASCLAIFMTGPFYHLHYALNKLKDHYPQELGGDEFHIPEYSEEHWVEARNRREELLDRLEERGGFMDARTARKKRLRRGRE